MGRGRPRKPNDMKLIDGTWRADRHGSIEGALKAEGTPAMPKGMSKNAKECWQSLIGRLSSSGRASTEDLYALRGLCEWWAEYCKVHRAMSRLAVSDKRYFRTQQLAAVAWKAFCTGASKFGLSPSDRAGMRIETQKPQGVQARIRA